MVEHTPVQELPSGVHLTSHKSSHIPVYVKQNGHNTQCEQSNYANVIDTENKPKMPGYTVVVGNSSLDVKGSQGSFSTFKPADENVTLEDEEVSAITNGNGTLIKKENVKLKRCLSQPQEYPTFIAASGEASVTEGTQVNLPMAAVLDANDSDGKMIKSNKLKKPRARSESGQRSSHIDHSPQRNIMATKSKTISPKHHISRIARSVDSDSKTLSDIYRKPKPKVPQRTVSLKTNELDNSKVNNRGVNRTQKERVSRTKAHSMISSASSLPLSTFRQPESIKSAQNGSDKPYVSQSLEMLVSQKLDGEGIDVTAAPYTDQVYISIK